MNFLLAPRCLRASQEELCREQRASRGGRRPDDKRVRRDLSDCSTYTHGNLFQPLHCDFPSLNPPAAHRVTRRMQAIQDGEIIMSRLVICHTFPALTTALVLTAVKDSAADDFDTQERLHFSSPVRSTPTKIFCLLAIFLIAAVVM